MFDGAVDGFRGHHRQAQMQPQHVGDQNGRDQGKECYRDGVGHGRGLSLRWTLIGTAQGDGKSWPSGSVLILVMGQDQLQFAGVGQPPDRAHDFGHRLLDIAVAQFAQCLALFPQVVGHAL